MGFVAADQLLLDDLADDPVGFVLLVLAGDDFDDFAFAELRPKFFGKEFGVVLDDFVGDFENPRGGTVVLLQFNDFHLRIVFLHFAQVFHVCAAPSVDGLVVVADGGKHAFRAGQELHQGELAGVGVLAFVNQQITQPPLPFVAHFAVLLQQYGGQAN